MYQNWKLCYYIGFGLFSWKKRFYKKSHNGTLSILKTCWRILVKGCKKRLVIVIFFKTRENNEINCTQYLCITLKIYCYYFRCFCFISFRAADWKLDQPDWTGRLRIVLLNNKCFLKLEDKTSGKLLFLSLEPEYRFIIFCDSTDIWSQHWFIFL